MMWARPKDVANEEQYEQRAPETAVPGAGPTEATYREAERHGETEEVPLLLLLRLPASPGWHGSVTSPRERGSDQLDLLLA